MTQNLKTRAYIMVNFMELPVKRFLDPKALTFRFWGLKTSLGQFGPKVLQKIYQAIRWEPWLQFSKTGLHFLKNYGMNPVKSWNLQKSFDLGVWGLETTLSHLGQKTYPTINPEPWLQFSQTRPHFLKNHEMNPIKLWNLKKFIDVWAWGLESIFESLGPRRSIQP